MGARSKSRKRALDILFEADQRGVNVQGLLLERLAKPVTQSPLADYYAPWDYLLDVVHHLILPVFVLGVASAAASPMIKSEES